MQSFFLLILALVVFLLSFLCSPSQVFADAPAEMVLGEIATSPSSAEASVEAYLTRFFEHTNGVQLKAAKKLIPAVVEAATRENLDPLLVAVVIACESTWRVSASGGVGEVGLMQLHGASAIGFAVDTVEGNLAAGCRWLAMHIQRADGDLTVAMKNYMGGNRKNAEWRIRVYTEEKKRQGL